MRPRAQRVVFARINRRRAEGEETIAARSFREDMLALAESHQTSFVQRGNRQNPTRNWVAADMALEPDGNFMTGTLGYTTAQQHRVFDTKNWSWIKSRIEETDTARDDTISPFAVDLRDQNRWVAFSPAARLGHKMFAYGFERVLNTAVSAAGLIPTEWEVDLVVSRYKVDRWIAHHPDVYKLKRTVKFTNPGRDFDSDREEMRKLSARRKTEDFAAASNQVLDTTSETFSGKLDGVDTGDIDLVLTARGERGSGDAIFNSKDSADSVNIENFGGDLIRGTTIVLAALLGYVVDKDAA